MYGDEKVVVEQRDGVVYAAPGSVTGAAKAEGCVRERAVSGRVEGPSFVLLSLIPSAINVFTYTLKDGKLDVKKDTFPKNAYVGLLQTCDLANFLQRHSNQALRTLSSCSN